MLSTPVVLLVFKRPHPTQRVFEQIRNAKPQKLFIVADGPRDADEKIKCDRTRAIVENVDWDCEVFRNYSETNLGCRKRVSSGLDWVFSQVEEAIILEDDCLPSASFFPYCQSLLDYYREDTRIMHIGGSNYQNGIQRTSYSYFFSKYNHIWGWATWRRAWKHYDLEIKSWPHLKAEKWLSYLFDSKYEIIYWSSVFDITHQGNFDTWDYSWMFACWTQNGLSIYPRINLISNIGWDTDSTHTLLSPYTIHLNNAPIGEMEHLLNHPPFMVRHREADIYTFDYFFPGKSMKENDGLVKRMLSSARKLWKRMEKVLSS